MSESLKIEALKATKHICLRSERNREFLTNYTRKGLDTGAGQVEGAGNSLIAAFCDSIKTEKSHRVHRAVSVAVQLELKTKFCFWRVV